MIYDGKLLRVCSQKYAYIDNFKEIIQGGVNQFNSELN